MKLSNAYRWQMSSSVGTLELCADSIGTGKRNHLQPATFAPEQKQQTPDP